MAILSSLSLDFCRYVIEKGYLGLKTMVYFIWGVQPVYYNMAGTSWVWIKKGCSMTHIDTIVIVNHLTRYILPTIHTPPLTSRLTHHNIQHRTLSHKPFPSSHALQLLQLHTPYAASTQERKNLRLPCGHNMQHCWDMQQVYTACIWRSANKTQRLCSVKRVALVEGRGGFGTTFFSVFLRLRGFLVVLWFG